MHFIIRKFGTLACIAKPSFLAVLLVIFVLASTSGIAAFAQSANGMAAVPSYARVDLLGS